MSPMNLRWRCRCITSGIAPPRSQILALDHATTGRPPPGKIPERFSIAWGGTLKISFRSANTKIRQGENGERSPRGGVTGPRRCGPQTSALRRAHSGLDMIDATPPPFAIPPTPHSTLDQSKTLSHDDSSESSRSLSSTTKASP